MESGDASNVVRAEPRPVPPTRRKVRKAQSRRQEIGLERRERTRQRLLAGAARVLAECGEHRATIDDFIRAADCARGTFYNYYQTGEDILADLWSEIGRNPFLEIEKACSAIDDPARRLAGKTYLVIVRSIENPTWGWVVYALSADVSTVNADLLRFPRPDLEAGQQAGRWKIADLAAATDMIVGTVRSAMHAVLREKRSQQYARQIALLVLKALGLSSTESNRILEGITPSASRPVSRDSSGTAA